ncbi:hypothetical protein [Romboutsia sp.]|uniref:hypothetical protein n=1 Tax=Romboutsia sp. TaxID=1965302 RepID=UPI002BD053C0|nr:hypothetical protein [Romboutsia sp.]HSQ90333.1 hypothetical protein [Romboutsia sp.]
MLELKGMEISNRIDELEKELSQAKLNDRLNWEYESMQAEKMELENELRSLGY